MRINLHQHTKRTKKSEPETRNLDINNEEHINLFINNLKHWDVGIVEITNHNFFDKKSFDILEERCKKEGILLLPGIEIDILDTNSKSHNLGIIVSNYKKDEWNEICSEFLTSDKYCDKFAIKLSDLIKKIESLEKIFLVPNKQKSNNNLELPIDDLKIIQNDKNGIWFFETTNKISSHILSYKGKRTFYGSDEKDIFNPKYKDLPDSKIKIDSFANLLKFLNKDLFFLRKEMEEKVLMEIEVCPKKWSENQKFPIFKDVNVIIGPRGVGKSELFKEIKTKINERSSKEYLSYEQNNNNYNQILNEITSKFQCTIDFQNEIHDLNSIFTIKTKSSFNFNEILKNFLSIGKFYKNQKITNYDAWTKIEFSSNLIKNTSDYNYFNNFYSDIKLDILNLRKTLEIIELNKNQSNFLTDNYILVKNYINKIIELKVEELKKLFIKNKSFNYYKKCYWKYKICNWKYD
ncbi:hypothetical protein [Spiroplasma endosymbiont of Monopis laevigella]|uniref:hypothetical protein n=1 Tax=Spiroplasma endosymbiont of Monopis laevigella TaxID=3066312 RepID=UPI0030CE74B2